jgi:hypothetical protein
MSRETVWLFSLLLTAHFIADFSPALTVRMREAKIGLRPAGPIAMHAGVHTVLVFAAVWAVLRSPGLALIAAAIEFPTHLAIDYGKMRLGARFEAVRAPTGDPFWYAFGVDQWAHCLVLVVIAASVL